MLTNDISSYWQGSKVWVTLKFKVLLFVCPSGIVRINYCIDIVCNFFFNNESISSIHVHLSGNLSRGPTSDVHMYAPYRFGLPELTTV